MIYKLRTDFRVGKMCEILGVSKSGYYSWLRQPKSLRNMENEKLLEKIELEYIKSRRLYGVRRVTAALKNGGTTCGHNRVARLMQENGMRSLRKRGRRVNTTDSRHEYPIAPNLLGRGYKATRPHQVWVSDLTYVPTGEGWLYLAAVEDICLKKVVGWSMDRQMTKELTMSALNQAIKRYRPPKGLLHHSDRGSQYACAEYRQLLDENHMLCSMSRKGNPYDNPWIESFFSTLKNECIKLNKFKTRAEARQAIFDFIEVYYNRQRLHSGIGYMTPFEYEQMLHREVMQKTA